MRGRLRAGLTALAAVTLLGAPACGNANRDRISGPRFVLADEMPAVDRDLGGLALVDGRLLTIEHPPDIRDDDRLVELTTKGSVIEVGDASMSTLTCGENEPPMPYSIEPAGQGAVSMIWGCRPASVSEIVLSDDGEARTDATSSSFNAFAHSWDVTRNHVWFSTDSRICATVSILEVDTGRFRQPDMSIDGEPVKVAPRSGTCGGGDANVGDPAVSPDGRYVALTVNTAAAGHQGMDRLSRPREIVVMQLPDLAIVRRYSFQETFGVTWSPDSQWLLASADTSDSSGMWLLRPMDDDRHTLVIDGRQSSAWSADGKAIYSLRRIGDPLDDHRPTALQRYELRV